MMPNELFDIQLDYRLNLNAVGYCVIFSLACRLFTGTKCGKIDDANAYLIRLSAVYLRRHFR
jgi:hypothetical protein